MTPPKIPAAKDASPSVSKIERVSYSSPAAAALSVQSMPPTMVAKAKGSTTGSFSSAGFQTDPQSKTGNNEGVPVDDAVKDWCSGTSGQPYSTPNRLSR